MRKDNNTRTSEQLECWCAASPPLCGWPCAPGGIYRPHDYLEVFAFRNPAAGNQTQESLHSNVLATYHMTQHLGPGAKACFRETASNNLCIQYDRTPYVLGVRWEQ